MPAVDEACNRVEKSFGGRTYHGNERTTFVIGTEGRIEAVLPRVKASEHAERLLEALRQ
jgi:thioredoxin-dependent peroxiredoxin